jgi:serine/threonine-protein kinase
MRSAVAERLPEDDDSRTMSVPGAVVPVALKDSIDLVKLGVIAEGGMGSVVRARQTSLLRDVAIKTTKARASPVETEALVREALVTGALEHPSIVPVHALGIDDEGRPQLVMKHIEGVSWFKLLRDPNHPAWSTHLGACGDALGANLDVLVHICRAVEFAHQRGIIHCDIKPSNVMLGRFGEVYLVDWGVAALRGATTKGPTGTASYMAPEMVGGGTIDERTDVYLLGATLHRALTGEPRHTGPAFEDKLRAAHVSEPYAYPSSVPPELADLCNAACAQSKLERPASVQQFREALLAFQRRRGPTAICRVAAERLACLERLVARPIPPSDLALAYRLATEARFGFAEGLAQCPDLDEARRGQEKTVEALVNLELQQEHVETAEALLEEVPRESLVRLRTQLEAARHAIVEKGVETRRLRALAMDLDPTVGRRDRSFFVGAFFLVQVLLALASQRPGLRLPHTVFGLTTIALVALVGTAAWVFVRRKWLLANAFSRRCVGFVLLGEGAVTVNHLLGLMHRTSFDTVAVDDLLLCAVMFAAGGFGLTPRLALAAPVFLAGIMAAVWRPDWSHTIFFWSGPVAVVLGFLAVETHARKSAVGTSGQRPKNGR